LRVSAKQERFEVMAVARRPTEKAGRPTASQAAELSRHIVQVARDLFFEFGYGATTMDAVAMRAGISKGSLYRRFPSKPDLFTAFFTDQTERWSAEDLTLGAPYSGDLANTLTARVDAFIGAGLSSASVNLARLVYAESGRFPEIAKTYQGGQVMGVESLAADLAAAAGRGEGDLAAFREPATFLQNMIAGYVLDLILQGRADQFTRQERAAWAAKAVAQFLHGYQPPKD
jgi:TetR/AcrR family transcriptional repressor of mexJK operon